MIEETHIESLIEKDDTPPEQTNVKGDKRNIFLLFVLYTLQGVPLGLSLSIPIIMQNMHKSSFIDQAKFSFAIWPFSIKLLWAPLIDSLYIRKLGRRKSWLIPVQYSLGIFFIITGFFINDWLMNADTPNVIALSIMFFILNFLAATQDIIVDGWAITMLKRKNISYAAMCNSAGQAFGIFLGFVFLIILMSETFWNKWRITPEPRGIISLQEYFYFWGIMYLVITTLVAIFKAEKDHLIETDAVRLNIIKTYKLLFSLIELPNIKMLALILFTVKISYGSIDAAYKLKLIDGGITKDQIAAIELLFTPLRIALPFFLPKYTSTEKPLKSYFNTIPYRLLTNVIFTGIIFFTPTFLAKTGPLLIGYKICLVLIYFLEQFTVCVMMLMAMSFYANISDPHIGGTNMTLLSTIANIGMVWSKTTALWFIDILTFKNCSNNHINSCSSKYDQNACESLGGKCQVIVDGFYVETLICTIYGIIWYFIFRNPIINLQSKHVKEWHVKTARREPL